MELGGEVPEDDAVPNLRATIKKIKTAKKRAEKLAKAEEKKALKKAKKQETTRKGNEYTQKVLLSDDKSPYIGPNGAKIRVSIHKESRVVYKVNEDNWTDEAHQRFSAVYPEGKAPKRVIKIEEAQENEQEKR